MDSLSIRCFKRSPVALALALWLIGLLTFPSLAAAALSPSQTSQGTPATDRLTDLQAVRQTLENKLVAQKLKDYGLNKTEVEAKLPRMSDADVHQIALLSKKLPQGGDAVGDIVVILIIVILIIVIIKLMNREVIVR